YPTSNAHARPDSGLRVNLELVHETARPGQPQAQPRTGRVPISQGSFDICNSRTGVAEFETQSPSGAVYERHQARRSTPAVLDRIAGQLAGRGHDLGLVDQAEADFGGPGTRMLAYADDVL